MQHERSQRVVLGRILRYLDGHFGRIRRDLDEALALVRQHEARVRDLEGELVAAHQLVRTDALTGALNRRGFEEAWSIESENSERNQRPLALAVVDIDNFKRVNDTYGHCVGDRVLAHLVEVARRIVRPTDYVARLGGEEFAIVLPGASMGTAIDVTERLQRGLTCEAVSAGQHRLVVTFSAGVAERQHGETYQDVLRRADDALYEAKRKGKNRILPAYRVAAVALETAA